MWGNITGGEGVGCWKHEEEGLAAGHGWIVAAGHVEEICGRWTCIEVATRSKVRAGTNGRWA